MPNASGGGVFGTGFFVTRLIAGSGSGVERSEYLYTAMYRYAFAPARARPPVGHSTRSSLGLGRYSRPTLAIAFPSTITTSAVKS
jgi:hypothetical protein